MLDAGAIWSLRRTAAAAVGGALRPLDAAFALGGTVERVVRRVLADQVAALVLASLDVVLASSRTDEAVRRVLDSSLVERALTGPELERLVAQAVDSPAAERLVARVIDSRLLDDLVTRLLESPELWLLVEEIAGSPAVSEAITQQSLGLADQVATEVRRTSSSADAWLERAARRVTRRRQRDDGTFGGAADAPAG
jgi:hypothetical protein